MSYDISLVCPHCRSTLELPEKHNMRGGTYAMGGTTDAYLNITYNYGSILVEVLGKHGIRGLCNKTGTECIPLLKEAIKKLDTKIVVDTEEDYWDSTPRNVAVALQSLLTICKAVPHGIVEIP